MIHERLTPGTVLPNGFKPRKSILDDDGYYYCFTLSLFLVVKCLKTVNSLKLLQIVVCM